MTPPGDQEQGTTDQVFAAAIRVVNNAYGTTPRHTKARGGGCRDDCIPCGITALRDALRAAGVDVL